MDVLGILHDLGYSNIKEDARGYRCAATYRGGNNRSSLLVYRNGYFIDFVSGERGGLFKLIKLTTGVSDVKKWLTDNLKTYSLAERREPKIRMSKIYPKEYLTNIFPDYTYANGRGISSELCKSLKCGVVGDVKGRLKNRFVFPILNEKGDLLGFTGRSLDNRDPKYLHMGEKGEWCWPYCLTKDSNSYVVVVESPFDAASLLEAGINNVICLFGVEMSLKVLNTIIQANPEKVIVSLNNDKLIGGDAGNLANDKLFKRLGKYIDAWYLAKKLPPTKDWNVFLMENGKEKLKKEFDNYI